MAALFGDYEAETRRIREEAAQHLFKSAGAPDIAKVGPEGYVHGWKFIGVPGSHEHANAIRDLADKVDKEHPDTQEGAVGGHLRSAADAMDKGDAKTAKYQLESARDNFTSTKSVMHSAVGSDEQKNALDNLKSIDSHLDKVDEWQKAQDEAKAQSEAQPKKKKKLFG